MSEARREIEAAIGDRLTPSENAELYVLLQGGATVGNVREAIEGWRFARHVRDDWGTIRGLILENAGIAALARHPRLLDGNGHG